MESIQNIVEFSQWPLLTAFVLGILVALHPCPMATNIAAMGYIGKDVENRRQVFVDGLLLFGVGSRAHRDDKGWGRAAELR